MRNGTVKTTNLQEKTEPPDEDEPGDGNNEGFEKLPGDGNKIGLFVLKIREQMLSLIKNQKVHEQCTDLYSLLVLLRIEIRYLWIENHFFNRFPYLFRLCHEWKVRHTSVSPRWKCVQQKLRSISIRLTSVAHLVFLGFALFILVAFGVFLIVWEKILRRSIERFVKLLSKSTGNNPTWKRVSRIVNKFFWYKRSFFSFRLTLSMHR